MQALRTKISSTISLGCGSAHDLLATIGRNWRHCLGVHANLLGGINKHRLVESVEMMPMLWLLLLVRKQLHNASLSVRFGLLCAHNGVGGDLSVCLLRHHLGACHGRFMLHTLCGECDRMRLCRIDMQWAHRRSQARTITSTNKSHTCS